MTPADILQLAKLLKCEKEESSSSEDDLPKTGYAAMGPGEIGKRSIIKIKGNEAEFPTKKELVEDPKSIWLASEVQEVPVSDDSLWDPRDQPMYDIIYKQAINAEDIFLQMSNKNPTTASCEYLQITITMLDECKSDIDCNVTKTNLDIRSTKYRLSLSLPHPVDPDSATAEWHSSSSQLIICLHMNREFDFVNF